MSTINFRNIRATPKSQQDSFEALAILLFQRSFASSKGCEFSSLRGEGGDGGVEAFFRDSSGAVHGVQAKYFFKLGASEFSQVKDSLRAALLNYPELQSYVIYIPFDLTGRKGGGTLGRSETERFEEWKNSQQAIAANAGKVLNIELVGASICKNQLLAIDQHGGFRRYWFDDATLTENTIRTCLDAAQAFAGPRYTELLDVDTAAHSALDFFGGTGDVQGWVHPQAQSLKASFSSLNRRLKDISSVLSASEQLAAMKKVEIILEGVRRITMQSSSYAEVTEVLWAARELLPIMVAAEALHYSNFCNNHGADKDTAAFRQFNAEYLCTFPAGDLDGARDAQQDIAALVEFLDGPAFQATRAQSLLLVGPAGIGKTHAIVSAAERRFQRGAYSIVLYGDDFNDPSPWEVIRSKLGLSGNIGRDEVFECLDACSAATSFPVVVFIDALNEGSMGSKWKDRLPEFLSQIKAYTGVKVCVSTRDTYKDIVVDSRFPGFAFIHPGFQGRELHALQAFGVAYGLDSEITPLFSEETANPLFLHLVCKTLCAKGAKSLDINFQGFLALFEDYLEFCNTRIRERLGFASPGNLVRRALLALSSASSAVDSMTWSDACIAIEPVIRGEVQAPFFMRELHNEGLIILSQDTFDEYLVRFGYQRYGDVLRCLQMISSAKANGKLDLTVLASKLDVHELGILEAMAYVLPESEGIEITELDIPKDSAYLAFIGGIVWRTKSSIGPACESIFNSALKTAAWSQVFETALKVSLVPDQRLNAMWLDKQLRKQTAPTRDAYLWYALESSFDESGVVKSLVDASLRTKLSRWPRESLWLAAVTLGWLSSSPDRRVRDQSTKGLMQLVREDNQLAKRVASHFCDCNDDYILESVSSAIYAACLLERPQKREQFIEALDALLSPGYDLPNAVIRDNIKLLALAIGPSNLDASILKRYQNYPTLAILPTSWPTEDEAKALLEHGSVVSNMDFTPRMMQPDFWSYEVKPELSRFDLKASGLTEHEFAFWVMCEVMRLGFPGKSNLCLSYDGIIANRHGQGRSRDGYAERIGKKYSWIAFHRLVGMLSDNLSPSRGWSEVAPGKEILNHSLRLRKADITDVRDLAQPPEYPAVLLPEAEYNFPVDDDARNWLDRDDLTPHEECLVRKDERDVEWFALSLSASSDQRLQVDDGNPYRRITLDYWAVLAPSTLNFNRKRDRIERELGVQAPNSYRAYMAEYPREAVVSYCLKHGDLRFGDVEITHAHVNILRGAEWEKDYSWSEESESLKVPTKSLVEELNLHWDQHSGWNDEKGCLAAFYRDGEKRSALFLRRDLLNKYLEEKSHVLYIRQFSQRGTIGGLGHDSTAAVDINALLIYNPQTGLIQLDKQTELFE